MPRHKFIVNKFLTLFQNVILNQHLSEYHTGYRAYSRDFLTRVSYEDNSDNFVFDNEILLQAIYYGFRIGEISCPTRYDDETSSISLAPGVTYTWQILDRTMRYCLSRSGVSHCSLFPPR